MNIIETHQLSRRFGRTEAVHDLDLAVPAGSVCALLGPNGAGKTTTIKLLMNLLEATGGQSCILGVESRRLGPAQLAQIGYVSENQQQPGWMTVRQLLDYCRPFYPSWDRDLERRLLEHFALPEQRRLRELSRGMLMKAALLSSLAYRPRLLVLDEPFSGLDALVREELVRGLLEVAAGEDWTVLVSSHDIDEVERLCDRVAVLQQGRLRFNEPAEALLSRFRRVEVQGAAETASPAAGWLEWARAGGLVSFVDPNYAGDATEWGWRERLPGATMTARPMSLREIFLTLARTERTQEQKGVAA